MHETALVRDVVRRIEDLAQATGARRITGAKIWLGALSHLSGEHFREHYALEAQGSIAAGAILNEAARRLNRVFWSRLHLLRKGRTIRQLTQA